MKEKFENYCKALKRLEEALASEPTALNMDATIQRFEFTYELAWNIIKAALFKVGIECLNPRDCIKGAFRQKYINVDKEDLWLDMIKDRNLSSHVYDQATAKKIYNKIKDQYFNEFQSLKNVLEAKI